MGERKPHAYEDVTSEIHIYERRLSLLGVSPLPAGRRHKQGFTSWRPTAARAKWSHGEPVTRIVLGGEYLHPDGSASVYEYYETYEAPASPHWQGGNQAPDWLLELFDIEEQHVPEQ